MENKNNNFAILALVAIVAVIGVVSLVMMMNVAPKATTNGYASTTMAGQAIKTPVQKVVFQPAAESSCFCYGLGTVNFCDSNGNCPTREKKISISTE